MRDNHEIGISRQADRPAGPARPGQPADAFPAAGAGEGPARDDFPRGARRASSCSTATGASPTPTAPPSSCSASPSDAAAGPADPPLPARDRVGPRAAPGRDANGRGWSAARSRSPTPSTAFWTSTSCPCPPCRARENGAVVILRDITRDREHEAQADRVRAPQRPDAAGRRRRARDRQPAQLAEHPPAAPRPRAAGPAAGRRAREPAGAAGRRRTKEVDRLDQIITQFLRAIRPTQPNLEQASVQDVLRETLAFLKHEIQDRDVLVEVEAPDDLPPVQVDREPDQAGLLQHHPQRHPGHAERRPAEDPAVGDRPVRGRSRSRTPGRASRPRTWARSSSRTTPPSPRARASG